MMLAEETMNPAENAPDLETPFWTFSLAVYGTDGVAEECLSLQERLGLDVNLLLFAAYLGAVEGLRLDAHTIELAQSAVGEWHGDIVRCLRQARQALKVPSADTSDPLDGASAMLRTCVKAAELEAERIEQAMLWRWLRANAHDLQHDGSALTPNLRQVLALYGDADAPSPHLIEAAIAYAAR
jgi:uncharacterized protein (TIGR02444 family)